jgi:ABC-type polysaccharide/polyol phosphate export permease
MVYQRANMIASGKMFIVNTRPPFMLTMFDWNPLFHCIDKARGFALCALGGNYIFDDRRLV